MRYQHWEPNIDLLVDLWFCKIGSIGGKILDFTIGTTDGIIRWGYENNLSGFFNYHKYLAFYGDKYGNEVSALRV